MKWAVVFELMANRLREMPPPLPVAWPNVPFVPTTNVGAGVYGADHIRAQFIRGGSDLPAMRGWAELTGGLQLDVFVREGVGELESLRIAGQLAGQFLPGLRLRDETGTVVRVLGTPTLANTIQEPGWSQTPLTIPWTAWVRI